MSSKRNTLLAYIKLIEELSLTKDEASTEGLELRFIESTGAFTWKEGVLSDKSFEVDWEIYNEIIFNLSINSSSEARELHNNLVKQNS